MIGKAKIRLESADGEKMSETEATFNSDDFELVKRLIAAVQLSRYDRRGQ